MDKSTVEIAGYDPNAPAARAAGEDFDDYANLITAIYRTRKSLGITQKQVAVAMGTKQSSVSDIERVGGNPTIRTLQKYARSVGMRLRFVATVPARSEEWEVAGSFDAEPRKTSVVVVPTDSWRAA